VDAEQVLMGIQGPGNMILDIFMDIRLAVKDKKTVVMQVALQPFGRYPPDRPITLPVRIFFYHCSHRSAIRSIRMEMDICPTQQEKLMVVSGYIF
jgi:hypothetical protein